MDPFLPGDIPVMVLRFLAANKCEASVFAFIEEMPILKVHINLKPSRVSNSDYLKYLSRSSVHLGLKDMLTDYMNSKILVEEILEEDESELSFDGRESLLNKVKCVQEKLNASSRISSMTRSPNSSSQKSRAAPEKSLEVKVDQFTNTDEDYECPNCCTNRQKIFVEFSCQTEDYVATTTEICCQTEDYVTTTTTEIGCQTEEYTAVSCGMEDEIPIMFYKTLLNDDGLQHKLAQTINEHIIQEEKDVVQKVSSKTESEIDKFLVEFLKDIPEDSSSSISSNIIDGQDLSVPSSFAEVENNLLWEAEKVLFGGSSNAQESVATVPEKLQPSSLPIVPTTTGTNVLPVTTPDHGATPKTPNTSSSSIDSREQSDDSSSPGSFNPRRSPRHHPVKRITPTRIPASSHPNPVFNSSIQIETHMAKVGDVNTKVSVKKTIFEQPAWSKLNRRDITPKTQGLIKTSEKPEKLRVTRTQSDAVWTFASTESHHGGESSSVEKSITPSVDLQKNKDQQKTSIQTIESGIQRKATRKATPVKLTPEKAKNSDYNFMHVYLQDKVLSAKKNDPMNADSSPKKTPVSTSDLPRLVLVTGASDANSSQIFINDNSQSDVTPMQLPPPVDSRMCSSSDLKTISPTALHRLIASANKVIGFSTGPTVNFINKKKSFSTPRKRKHIRNLTFATPPSLKAITPSPTVGDESCERKSRKHKATEDLLPIEFKSKKRLKWPGSDKKVVSPIPEIDSEKTPEPTRRHSKQSLMLPPENFNPPQQVNTVDLPFGLSEPNSQNEPQQITTVEVPLPLPPSNPIPSPIPVPTQISNEQESSKFVDSVPAPSNRRGRSKQKSGQSETEKVSATVMPAPITTPADQTLPMETLTFHSAFEPPPPEVPKPKRKSRAKKKAPVVKLKLPNKSSTTVPPSIPYPPPVPQIPQQENAVFNTIQNPPVTTIPVSTTGFLQINQNTESIQKPVSETFLAPTPSKPAAPPPPETSQQEPIIFNIVAAPLGFSEPTPIKNFAETGYLNISQIGFNCNSPLITPLKSLPPQALNESHFTLPPTPRMIEDQDSNSNSTHSLRLLFEGGLYPVNLLSSTPLKSGIPRTPGRESSSSNSHSPIAPETVNTTQVQGQAQPVASTSQSQSQIPQNITNPSAITTTIVPPIPVTSVPPVTTFTTPTTTSIVPTITTATKSDGEVTSSDDEEERPGKATTHYKSILLLPRKPIPKTTPDPPKSQSRDEPRNSLDHSSSGSTASSSPPCKASGGRSTTSRENGRHLQSSIIVPASAIANYSHNPATHPYVQVQSNIKQTQGINFQVGGRGKKLTLSEQETLYSLLQIGGNTTALHQYHIPPNTERKENRPSPLEPVQNNSCQIPLPQKPSDEPPGKPHNLQQKNLMSLIKFIVRKNPNQPNASIPKNN